MKAGDRVGYRAAFLRQIGDYSKDSADRRATVLEVGVIKDPNLVRIKWDDMPSTSVVRTTAIAPVGTVAFYD